MLPVDWQTVEYILIDAAAVGWFGLQVAIASIALFILLSSLDDLYVDATYWFLKLKRAGHGNAYDLPDNADDLMDKPQRPLAVMVPAWDESAVIARMIANTIANMQYDNYHIFVGVYPNDPDTRDEVDRMGRMYPNVHRVNVGNPGPSSKADCLNWLIQGIFRFEQDQGFEFAGVVLHDAEDVIHPYSFGVVNWVLPYLDLIQLPVYSMPRRPGQMVASHYMDEFAEWHTKDMVVREALTGIVPSAGVATTFSRRALDELCRDNENLPFNTDSLTEDYDVAQRIQELGLRGGFVRHELEVPYEAKDGYTDWKKEVVSTREFFPDKLKYSIRQKARWMLGISFVGWEQIGWRGSLGNRYFLYRDRKGIVTAPLGMLAYFVVLNVIMYMAWYFLAPVDWRLPTLVEAGSPAWYLVMVNLVFLCSRVFHRMFFVWKLHGPVHALISPVRIVVSNFISFFASFRAARQYFVSRMTGARLTWDKTSHNYPSASEILDGKARLGEVLAQMGAVRPADVDAALAEQGNVYRPLGLLMLDQNLVSDEDLAKAFAELSGLTFESFSVHEVPDELVDLVPQRLAAEYGAFPIRTDGNRLIIGMREPLTKPQKMMLEAGINTDLKIAYVLSPRSDISFAIRFAYDGQLMDDTRRDIDLLKMVGVVNTEDVTRIWRGIRRSYTPFADLAVRLGYVTHAELVQHLGTFWGRSDLPFIGDFLLELGLLTDEQVNEILLIQDTELSDALTIAAQLGLISEGDRVQLEEERERS